MSTSLFQRITLAAAALLLAVPVAMAAPPKTKLDTPTIVAGEITPSSIDIVVTAGATGAPAGFSLQWMTLDQYVANGNMWYASEVVCKASFSGNANGTTFNLASGQSVTVNIGDSLFDQAGASSNCIAPLDPCTTYVFHAFAHATSKLAKSDFTANLEVATSGCANNFCRTYPNGYGGASYGACTMTQGYWKTHGVAPTGNNWNEWAFTTMVVGGVEYSAVEIQAILNTSGAGNGLVTLAHQLITAMINRDQGAPSETIDSAIAAANAFIQIYTLDAGKKIPPAGTALLPKQQNSAAAALITALADFNEGATGPGHCGGSDDGCTRPSAPDITGDEI
jgi:hypothetical protein